MQIIAFTVLLAYAAAAPAYFDDDFYNSKSALSHGNYIGSPLVSVLHTPVASKTTITKSSQVVNHGGTHVVHSVPVAHSVPVVHSGPVVHTPVVQYHAAPVVHAPVVHSAPILHHVKYAPAKSSQYFHLDNTVYRDALVHTPVVHAPVVHSVHTPVVSLVHSSPVVVKTGASAVSHQSSTVHETVPVVKSYNYLSHH